MKDKQINTLEDSLEKVKLEKEKAEREIQINSKDSKQKNTKDSERTIAKLKEKLNINE